MTHLFNNAYNYIIHYTFSLILFLICITEVLFLMRLSYFVETSLHIHGIGKSIGRLA